MSEKALGAEEQFTLTLRPHKHHDERNAGQKSSTNTEARDASNLRRGAGTASTLLLNLVVN